jgi:uncharacterized membrane protein (Fun14 family)
MPTLPLSIRLISLWLLATVDSRLAMAAPAAPPPAPTEPAANHSADIGGMFDEVFFLKLGFSFMVGLAMGFALKVAFKIALLVMGLILLGIFALQYTGFIDVNWSGLEIHYDSWFDWLSANAGAFFGFVGDNLTSTASFIAGLALGLKY